MIEEKYYKALARKWRPQSFKEIAGQQQVLSVLENSIKKNKIHHAYLFIGTRGVGKTTLARIMAKRINCLQAENENVEPCNNCSSCNDINLGKAIDTIEIDAASKTKINDTREIIDNIQYLPTKAKHKIFIIDEVHMLSNASFNALLKTLEEPPKHVKFLLATTEEKKIPITITSRCVNLNLTQLRLGEIQTQLASILYEENIKIEKAAIKIISEQAKGSMRDAISITEQIIAYSDNEVSVKKTQEVLNIPDDKKILNLLEDICNQNPDSLFLNIKKTINYNIKAVNVINDLQEKLHAIYLNKIFNSIRTITDQLEPFIEIAQNIDSKTIQKWYKKLLISKQHIQYHPNENTALESCLLELFNLDKIEKSNNSNNIDHKINKVKAIEPQPSAENSKITETAPSNQHKEAKDINKIEPNIEKAIKVREELILKIKLEKEKINKKAAHKAELKTIKPEHEIPEHITAAEPTHEIPEHITAAEPTHEIPEHITAAEPTHEIPEHITAAKPTHEIPEHITAAEPTHEIPEHITAAEPTHEIPEHITAAEPTHEIPEHHTKEPQVTSSQLHTTSKQLTELNTTDLLQMMPDVHKNDFQWYKMTSDGMFSGKTKQMILETNAEITKDKIIIKFDRNLNEELNKNLIEEIKLKILEKTKSNLEIEIKIESIDNNKKPKYIDKVLSKIINQKIIGMIENSNGFNILKTKLKEINEIKIESKEYQTKWIQKIINKNEEQIC